MSQQLPVLDKVASRQEIVLEDVPYQLLLTWNERTGGWTIGLEDRDGLPVILGRRVVLQLDIFFGYRHLPGMPTGSLFALDTTGQLTGVGREDLTSGRAVLIYYTEAEINALRS